MAAALSNRTSCCLRNYCSCKEKVWVFLEIDEKHFVTSNMTQDDAPYVLLLHSQLYRCTLLMVSEKQVRLR